MKKLVTLSLLILCALLLVACGNTGNDGIKKDKIVVDFSNNGSDPAKRQEVSVSALQADLEKGKYMPFDSYTGYYFLGFYTQDGLQCVDKTGLLLEGIQLTGGTVLMARYEKISIKLDFHSLTDNEGKETVSYSYGDTLNDFPSVEITNPRYELDGWFDISGTYRYSNGTKPTYELADNKLVSFGSTEDNREKIIPLYPKLRYKEHKVTVEYGDGVTPSESFYLSKGSRLDLSSYYRDKGNMDIIGWSSMAGVTTPIPSEVNSDIVVYAVWKQYKNVEFVYNDEVKASKIYYGVGESSELLNEEIPGYKLLGWSVNEDLSGDVVLSVPYGLLADKYYASLSQKSYQATLMNGDEFYQNLSYNYGSLTMLPRIEADGYTYGGWCENGNGIGIYYISPEMWGNKTLNVKLIKNEEAVTVSLLVNGSTYDSQVFKKGDKIVLPVCNTDEGRFLGWQYENGEMFIEGQIATESMVLEAKIVNSEPISCIEDFNKITVNGNYHLTNDIDLKFKEIPHFERFAGVIDGCGYTISNLALNSSVIVCGIFETNEGEIKNLNFKNVIYKNNSENSTRGAIITANNKGKIINCHILSGKMEFNGFDIAVHGGISAEAMEGSLIQDCSVNLEIVGSVAGDKYSVPSYVGGIVGIGAGTINNCNANIKINIKQSEKEYKACLVYAGGLIGGQKENTSLTVSNCYATGEITIDDYSDTKIYSSAHYNVIGGLIGGIFNGTVSSCYTDRILINSKNFQANYQSYAGISKGAFVGLVGANAEITNAYSKVSGALFVNKNSGFAGFVIGKIENCFSYSEDISQLAELRNGFVGYLFKDGTITNCFTLYDKLSEKSLNGTQEACYSGSDVAVSEDFIFETLGFNKEKWNYTEGELPTLIGLE